jgi:hypothetical protein
VLIDNERLKSKGFKRACCDAGGSGLADLLPANKIVLLVTGVIDASLGTHKTRVRMRATEKERGMASLQ